MAEAAQLGSADDVAAAIRAARALGLTDEIAAAEVAVSTRLEEALEALEEAADAGFARDVESAAARALALGGADAEAKASGTPTRPVSGRDSAPARRAVASTSTVATAARAGEATRAARERFRRRAKAAAETAKAAAARGGAEEAEAAAERAEQLGETAAAEEARAMLERRRDDARARLDEAVAAASAEDAANAEDASNAEDAANVSSSSPSSAADASSSPPSSAADAAVAAAAETAAALGPDLEIAAREAFEKVRVARERRRRAAGRVVCAYSVRQYSGDDECALHDFDGRPGPARELTEAEGGARAHGWNELRDGAAEAAAASRARGWGRLAWPPPRWPPPNLVVDAWEAKISALVRDAETRALADIAAADAADDSATQSAPETSRSAPARAASTSWTTLSAATVEANCGASSPSDARRLDLAAENVRDVSALPDLCPRLRALVLNVNALDTLDGLERLPLLRRLSARHNAIRVPGFVAGGFRELRALALDGNPLRSLDHLAEAAPSLEAFSARACGLGAAAFAAELATPRLSATLTELHLAGNPLGARGVSTLTEKSEFPNLLKLNVSDARVVYLEGLERCPLLSVLVATENRIVRLPESFRRRRDGSGSGACPPGGGAHAALRELRLDRNRLEEIPDLWLPSLTNLHARENRVRRIGDLGGAPHLAVLDVAFNRVGDVPGAPPLRPAFDVATAPRLERLALNDTPVAAVEGYPDELFPFLQKLREVDGASVPREAIVAATDALARDTPLLAETLGEALERRRARRKDENRIAKDAPMIAESVGTEKLEAMSRARWEARLASDRQALVRARKHLARVDDDDAAAGMTIVATTIVATTTKKTRSSCGWKTCRTRASARRRTRDRDASMSIRTRTTRTRFPRMSRGDASNRRETPTRSRVIRSLSLHRRGRLARCCWRRCRHRPVRRLALGRPTSTTRDGRTTRGEWRRLASSTPSSPPPPPRTGDWTTRRRRGRRFWTRTRKSRRRPERRPERPSRPSWTTIQSSSRTSS